MHSIVREVFFLLMMVTIAALLYFVFFGVSTPDGSGWIYQGKETSIQGHDGTPGLSTTQTGPWQGVLYWMARSLENPIAYYYYNYCLVPNVHQTDYLDAELGCKIYGRDFGSLNGVTGNNYNTGATIKESLDYIEYPSGSHYCSSYTCDTGW